MTEPFASMTAEEAERFMATKFGHPIRDAAAKIVGPRPVVDFGCGRGIRISELYAPEQYIGIDCSLELVKLARKANPDHEFRVCGIEQWLVLASPREVPFGLMISVLEHVDSLETAQRIYRMAADACKELLVGWHHPPIYTRTQILKVPCELNHPENQNHYKAGSFDAEELQVERQEVAGAELWRVTHR